MAIPITSAHRPKRLIIPLPGLNRTRIDSRAPSYHVGSLCKMALPIANVGRPTYHEHQIRRSGLSDQLIVKLQLKHSAGTELSHDCIVVSFHVSCNPGAAHKPSAVDIYGRVCPKSCWFVQRVPWLQTNERLRTRYR